jgi:hypothetical protein
LIIAMGAIERAAAWALNTVSNQPSVPSSLILGAVFATIIGVVLVLAVFDTGAGLGASRTPLQRLLGLYVQCGRVRNLLCSPCDQCRRRYPVANTCQVPFFSSLSDIYNFVFGFKREGLFVEVGAFDGESFSNTSCLADLGWQGHYLEPIPQYAAACRRRHISNPGVTVHNIAAGQTDGVEVTLTPAGPFTSAVADELQSVADSNLSGALAALGWMPKAEAGKASGKHGGGSSSDSDSSPSASSPSSDSAASPCPVPPAPGAAAATEVREAANGQITMRTTSLDTFFRRERIAPGAVDVMVIDVEGLEWPILQGFALATFRPKLVIVEIQEKQARFIDNARVQRDAAAIEAYFADAGYSIFYRDVVNTIFIAKEVRCRGGD